MKTFKQLDFTKAQIGERFLTPYNAVAIVTWVSPSAIMYELELEKTMKRAKANLRFQYYGGGYFRDKHVPLAQYVVDPVTKEKVLKTEKADIVHGDEIINEFYFEIINQLKKGTK